MKLLLNTHSNHPDWNGHMDCAVVDVSDRYLQWIERQAATLLEIREREPTADRILFSDYVPDWWSYDLIDTFEEQGADAPVGAYTNYEPWPLTHANESLVNIFDENHEPVCTECDRIVLYHNGRGVSVMWEAVPKHSSTTVETVDIEVERLRELYNNHHPPKQPA